MSRKIVRDADGAHKTESQGVGHPEISQPVKDVPPAVQGGGILQTGNMDGIYNQKLYEAVKRLYDEAVSGFAVFW